MGVEREVPARISLIMKGRTAFGLGKFIPSKLDKRTIEFELTNFLESHELYSQGITIRDPKVTSNLARDPEQAANAWHNDCFGMQQVLVVWSNQSPTEIKEALTDIKLEFEPYDVIVVDNGKALHRTPLVNGLPVEYRWFARATVIA